MKAEELLGRGRGLVGRDDAAVLAFAVASLPTFLSVVEAAQTLAARLDAVHASPAYRCVWGLYAAHGGVYTGPSYEAEFGALRALLEGEAGEAGGAR